MPIKYNEKDAMNLLFFIAESRYAFTTIKKGFISSLGCKAKKPIFIHLFAPLIFEPIIGQTHSIRRQHNKPIKHIFKILFLESIDIKIIIKMPIKLKHKCLVVK